MRRRHFSRSQDARRGQWAETETQRGRLAGRRQTIDTYRPSWSASSCYCDVRRRCCRILSWNRHESGRLADQATSSLRFPTTAISAPSIKPETRLGMWLRGGETWRHAGSCRARLAITRTRRITDSLVGAKSDTRRQIGGRSRSLQTTAAQMCIKSLREIKKLKDTAEQRFKYKLRYAGPMSLGHLRECPSIKDSINRLNYLLICYRATLSTRLASR